MLPYGGAVAFSVAILRSFTAILNLCLAQKNTEGNTMAKNKHLTDTERIQIEHLLRNRTSIKRIAGELGKSTSTV